jgi:hypothetical protein
MTARRAGTSVALLAGTALLVAACTGASPTTAPTSAAATQPPPTTAPPTQAAPSQGLPGLSFAIPSFTSDAELDAMFPKEIGGEPIHPVSMSGANFLSSGFAGAQIGPALQQLGKSPSDMSVAFAGTMDVTVVAFRIKGLPGEQFLNAYAAAAGNGAGVTDASFGGKSVKKVSPSGAPAVYVYVHGDVIWTVGGNNPTDALVNEAFSKLP